MTSVDGAAAGAGRRPTLRMYLFVLPLGLIVLLHVGLCLTPVADRHGDFTAEAERSSAAAMAWPTAVDTAAGPVAVKVAEAEPTAEDGQVGVEHRCPRLPVTDHHVGCRSAATGTTQRTGGAGPPWPTSAGPLDPLGPPGPLGSLPAGAARPSVMNAASWPMGAGTSLLTRLSVSLT